MAWIFQGNPNRFDIDDYLSRYPQLIYWRTNRYAKDISVGDPVFIWRAGDKAGAIAVGQIVEPSTLANEVKHPEALADELWVADEADPSELKTGIELNEIRLSVEDGMVARSVVADTPVLATSTIITVPNGTVFRLSADESAALGRLWGSPRGYCPDNRCFRGATAATLSLCSRTFITAAKRQALSIPKRARQTVLRDLRVHRIRQPA